MEQLPVPAGGSKANAAAPLHLTLDNTTYTSSPSPSPPQSAGATAYAAAAPSLCSNHERGTDTLKAKILSHPLYAALLRAFIECRKVGAPPEVVGRLSNLAGELESHPGDRQPDLPDPELDEFMETYCHMLVRYKQELTRPIQEADQFFRAMEAQMDSFALDDNSCKGGDSSEDEHETGDVAGLPPTITGLSSGEDEGLKKHLLNKYSGYLSTLWEELSRKKKKKGKLPRDARQKLLHWWQLHYRWPYPSELEKVELSVTTGLDAKQINNWFINQRKRHWKPTAGGGGGGAVEYMWQPAATYGAGAASSSSYAAGGVHRVEGRHFAGGSSYPRGP